MRLELVFFLCNVSHETILYRFLAGVNLCFLASERRVEWFMFFLSLWLSKSISINFVKKPGCSYLDLVVKSKEQLLKSKQ